MEINPTERGHTKMLAYKQFLVSFTQAGKPKFGCGLCPADRRVPYTDRKNVFRHLESQHLKLGKFKCDQCEKMFSRADALKKHKLTHDPDRLRISCSLCQK